MLVDSTGRTSVDGRLPAPVEVGTFSHYLQDFIHPRWFSRRIPFIKTVVSGHTHLAPTKGMACQMPRHPKTRGEASGLGVGSNLQKLTGGNPPKNGDTPEV